MVSGISSGSVLTKNHSINWSEIISFTYFGFVWVMTCEHRLENEHLNNVGKFRAFKSVPLPFNYDEE